MHEIVYVVNIGEKKKPRTLTQGTGNAEKYPEGNLNVKINEENVMSQMPGSANISMRRDGQLSQTLLSWSSNIGAKSAYSI